MLSREMKDSGVEWIGEIPKEWELRKLRYILTERNEKNSPIKTNNILSLSVKRGVFPYSEKVGGGNKSKEDLTAYKLAYPDDIVINSMNILAGAVGLSTFFGAVSPVYYTLFSNDENINVNYYYSLFLTKEFQKSLLGLGNGIMMKESENGKLNTIRMRISINKLSSLILPVPSLKEQRIITQYLNDRIILIDTIISDTHQSTIELKKYKQSLITETVTKGLDKNVEKKDSGIEWIGKIPRKWRLIQFKNIAKVRNGKEIKNEKGDIPVFGSGGIFKKTDEILYSKESILFGRKGTIGKPILVSKPFWTIDTMFYTEINKNKIAPKYLLYILLSIPWNWITTQTALPSIVGTEVGNLKIPYVELGEQQKIVDFLDEKTSKIHKLIKDKEQIIREYEEYKKSLIYEYVTGKKQV